MRFPRTRQNFEYKYRQATIESQLISTKPSACDNKCLGRN